uniref:APC family permease n=1 Tax=Nonomuraea bangladeshensis TaxID=404385 RepID=UPI003F4925AF
MGTTQLVLAVLAFSAPLTVVIAWVPFLVIYNGIGAPSAYIVAMALVLVFAVGFGTMTRYMPNPGAFYAYITAGLGRIAGLGAGFLSIYAYLLLMLAGAAYAGFSTNGFVSEVLGGPDVPWYWYTLALWASVSILGYFNVELSAKVLAFAMMLEIVVIVGFDLAVFADGGPEGRSVESFTWSAFTSGSVGLGLLFAVVSFLGFEGTAIYREETKDPVRTVRRATVIAVLFMGLLYAVSAWMLITSVGTSKALAAVEADPGGIYFNSLTAYVGGIATDVAQILIVTSWFACVLSMHNVLTRYGFSLGTDGVLPRLLGRVHPRHRSPYVASIAVSGLVLASALPFVLAGADPVVMYGQLAGVSGFAIVVLLLLTSLAVLVYFRRKRALEPSLVDASPWRTVVAPTVSTIGLGAIFCLALVNFTTMIGGSLSRALLLQALTWSVLGAGFVTAVVYRRYRPEVYRRIGRQQG